MTLFKELYKNSCCLMNFVKIKPTHITYKEVNWNCFSDLKHKISTTTDHIGRNTTLARGRYYRRRPEYLYTRRHRTIFPFIFFFPRRPSLPPLYVVSLILKPSKEEVPHLRLESRAICFESSRRSHAVGIRVDGFRA